MDDQAEANSPHEVAQAPDDTATCHDEFSRRLGPENVRSIRIGHGANCSSIGSVVDTLFASAVIGSAVFAAIVAALKTEPIRVVVGPDGATKGARPRSQGGLEDSSEHSPRRL